VWRTYSNPNPHGFISKIFDINGVVAFAGEELQNIRPMLGADGL
jgi:hypothetical protein